MLGPFSPEGVLTCSGILWWVYRGAVGYFECLSIVITGHLWTSHSYQLQAVRVLTLHHAASLSFVLYLRYEITILVILTITMVQSKYYMKIILEQEIEISLSDLYWLILECSVSMHNPLGSSCDYVRMKYLFSIDFLFLMATKVLGCIYIVLGFRIVLATTIGVSFRLGHCESYSSYEGTMTWENMGTSGLENAFYCQEFLYTSSWLSRVI